MTEAIRRLVRRDRLHDGSLPGAAALGIGLVVCLLAAGCGGGAGSAVAQVGSTSAAAATDSSTTTGAAAQELALLDFARCMRGHGVSAFPDPGRNADGTYGFSDLAALRRLVHGDQQAFDACLPLLSKSGILSRDNLAAFQQQMLVYARCMRSHGVASFPDPKANGRFGGQLKGLDRNTPTYRAAATACRPALTRAIDVFSVNAASG